MIYLALVLSGLCFGSFTGALVWRLRARQLVQDKAVNEEYDKDEYRLLKKLTNHSIVNDRSRCLRCDYQLKWYDLVPLLSWLSLGGKCRNCHKGIGYFELIIELAVMLFFVLSYAFWPYTLTNNFELARFIIWMISGVCLAILASYDTKWFLLPDKINYILVGLGVVSSGLVLLGSPDITDSIVSITGAVVILSGTYLILYLLSKGKWIGFGDIKLGLGLALLLGDWQLAFVALFAANMIGTLIVIPAIILGKLDRSQHVPFGPLLIVGTIIAQISGHYLISLYMSLIL